MNLGELTTEHPELAQAFYTAGESLRQIGILLGAKPESPKRRTKRVKDPNTKKRLSGYIIFCNEHRQEVVAKNPGMNQRDITRELGSLWNGTVEEVKEKWKIKAAQLTAEPASEPAVRKIHADDEDNEIAQAKKRKVDSGSSETKTSASAEPSKDEEKKKKKKKKSKHKKEEKSESSD